MTDSDVGFSPLATLDSSHPWDITLTKDLEVLRRRRATCGTNGFTSLKWPRRLGGAVLAVLGDSCACLRGRVMIS
jgi:hypothetical protein